VRRKELQTFFKEMCYTENSGCGTAIIYFMETENDDVRAEV
jgi:hypothetical protein